MCVICVQFELGKLTKREARQALLEMIQTEDIDLDHQFEVADLIQGNSDAESEA